MDRRKQCIAAMLAVAFGGPVSAGDLPDFGFFTGPYEAVGRQPGGDGAVFAVMTEMKVTDERLVFEIPGLGDGWLGPNPSTHEAASPFAGRLGPHEIACLFQIDPNNYARLTCVIWSQGQAGPPGVVTFWPLPY